MKFPRALALVIAALFVFSLSASAVEYNEAPMLAEMVEARELPPVNERLPIEPFVVGPGVLVSEENLNWEVGQYGGTLRTAHVGTYCHDANQSAFEGVLDSPGFSQDNIVGNAVRDFEISDDATEFTFYLREGLRWSDGVPVTTEDVRFTFEDVYQNKDIYPIFPQNFRSGGRPNGTPVELEIIDEYTFRLTFDEPYGAFTTKLAMRWVIGVAGIFKPRHYLEQFHIDYTSLEDMRDYLDEQELTDEWWVLFNTKDIGSWQIENRDAIGFPVLYPWMRVESPSGVTRLERNPYYFKVDTEGNQLPYIDRIESHHVSDLETGVMRTITGEIDYLRSISGLPHLPVYQENADRAGYRVTLYPRVLAAANLIINDTYEDPVWQELVSDIRFRQALSYAIDRQEVLDSVFLGQADLPEWVYEEYARFDPQRAEALLDELGMTERDSAGFRLGPDGEPFDILIETHSDIPELLPTSELVVEYLQDIGLDVSMRHVAGEYLAQKRTANELQATVSYLHPGGWPDIFTDFLPGSWGWGVEWQTWRNSEGELGEEPPDWVKEVYHIYDEHQKSIPGTDEHQEWVDALFDWFRDHMPMIIITEQMRDPFISSARLGNVPHAGYAMASYMSTEQMFFRSE